jgi:hypothetical protein
MVPLDDELDGAGRPTGVPRLSRQRRAFERRLLLVVWTARAFLRGWWQVRGKVGFHAAVSAALGALRIRG